VVRSPPPKEHLDKALQVIWVHVFNSTRVRMVGECVCVCVCMGMGCVCVCVCVCVIFCVCMCDCLFVCMCVDVGVDVGEWVCVYMCVPGYLVSECVCVCLSVCLFRMHKKEVIIRHVHFNGNRRISMSETRVRIEKRTAKELQLERACSLLQVVCHQWLALRECVYHTGTIHVHGQHLTHTCHILQVRHERTLAAAEIKDLFSVQRYTPTYMFTRTYIHGHIRTYTRTYSDVHTRTYTDVHTRTYTQVFTL
jgi:hypothetical protein